MIKKDVVFDGANEQKEEIVENFVSPSSEVDAIFAMADKKMIDQKSKLLKQKDKKKRKKHPILRFVITSILILVVCFGLFIYSFVGHVKESYPAMKQDFLQQVELLQSNLKKVDDSTLTLEEYYQKKMWLLFTTDEIEDAIENVEDLRNLQKLFDMNGSVDLTLFPEEKMEEYEKLLKEYELAASATGNTEN